MASRKFALISMPWFWAHMPSIQLAIVKDVLGQHEIGSDVFEFYADFVAIMGRNLYGGIANTGSFIGELLFTQFYFDAFDQRHNRERPHLSFNTKQMQDDIFLFATPLIDKFLDNCLNEIAWEEYDAACFSLTATQNGASIALAKRVRARHPDLPIIFGGSSCAGEMGEALLEMCPEVDIAVHAEAEAVLPLLADAMAGKRSLAEVPGISWRSDGGVVTNAKAGLHSLARTRNALDFEAYFKRIANNKVLTENPVWIPFEGSRGCWYGEKSQCTFCGLNEIIKYRERSSGGLLDELAEYQQRYGVRSFFAVDLIMPLSFFKEFLPSVERAGKNWTIFYEIKSNMKRHEIELLARSGVRWIQPGIESLDDKILKLMRKGVTAAHNVQTLRLAGEQGVAVSWNLITGFPKEVAASYDGMAELFPKLHHLDAPSGLGPFEVHRFSPFFEEPESMGIRLEGPHPKYRTVFPVEDSLLERLVYRFEYSLIEVPDPAVTDSVLAVGVAADAWRKARARRADFTVGYRPDRTAVLTDTRLSETPVITLLDRNQAALLRFLDEMRPAARLVDLFAAEDPIAFEALGRADGVARQITLWCEQHITLAASSYIQALPKILAPSQVEAVAA